MNYDKKDLMRVGFHDYDKDEAEKYLDCNTFSVRIFQWVNKSKSKKEMKQSKCVVRVYGIPANKEKVFTMCDLICKQLDAGEWDGRKTVTVK